MRRYIVSFGMGLGLALASLLVVSSPGHAGQTSVNTLSTGIGEVERGPHTGYSTVMYFSERGSGSMLADVKVSVYERGKRGEGRVLDTMSPDPLLYANLPAGKYYVEAQYRGQEQGSSFVVDGKCLTVVGLSWPTAKVGETQRMARGEHEHHARTYFNKPCTVTRNTSG